MQSDAVVNKLTGTQDVNCRSQPHDQETSDVNWTSERLNFHHLLLGMWTTKASINSPDCKPTWQMQSDVVVNKLTGTQDVNCRSRNYHDNKCKKKARTHGRIYQRFRFLKLLTV